MRLVKTCTAIIALFLVVMFFAPNTTAAQDQATGLVGHPTVAHSLPLTRFYDTPDPLPAGKPGDLIRSMPFDDYDLPREVSAVRILYFSRSARGANVAASGVVLFPNGKPPKGGWPVIAWAHEISAVERQCAPSLTRNLQHGPFLSMYVRLGYAIVATDYAGLGTKFRSAFADATSNAYDIIYSIPAARQAVPQLGWRWIAMGTREGGMAALSVAELELADSNYLGSIAISHLSDLQGIFGPGPTLSPHLALFLAYGIKTVYPQFEVEDILTDKAISLYQHMGKTCSGTEVDKESSVAGMLKPNWPTNKFVQDYFSRNRLGLKPARAPLLVLSSEADPSAAETTKVIARLCKQGDQVQFVKYPEYDSGQVIGDSVRDQMAWIQARFAQAPARGNCAQH